MDMTVVPTPPAPAGRGAGGRLRDTDRPDDLSARSARRRIEGTLSLRARRPVRFSEQGSMP